MTGSNELLTSENIAGFFAQDKPLKAVLFTKKTETPKLWMRLAEEWGQAAVFGEVRHSEQSLLVEHGVMDENLPCVMAFVAEDGDGEPRHRPFVYDGPTEFDHISDFLGDLAKGGMSFLEMRRLAEARQKQIESLRVELEREREALAVAKAEIARSMLDKVGFGEAFKKDLNDARERERALEAAAAALKAENQALLAEVKVMQEVQHALVVKLRADNVHTFLSNTTRPLKAVLFTTKTETPPLWLQLAEAQCTTTAFGVVHHTELSLMEQYSLEVSDLPRICIFPSGAEPADPVVYDGEVSLDALISFMKDTVEGGDAVIAMRQQVHHAMREIERLTAELSSSQRDVERLKASVEEQADKGGECNKCVELERRVEKAAEAAEALAGTLRTCCS